MANRANKITVTATSSGFVATFFLTHKELTSVATDGNYHLDPKQNRTLQRELFRQWACDNAAKFGIDWDPNDRRSETNLRAPKYTSNAILADDAIAMIRPDIREFLAGTKIPGLTIGEISLDDICPMETSPKGADLRKLGILDGKYANGNWAWALVNLNVQIDHPEFPSAWIILTMALISGQLKKPTNIGEGGYTMTSLKTMILDQIPQLKEVPAKAESAAAEPVEETTADEKEPETIAEAVAAPKGKVSRKAKK